MGVVRVSGTFPGSVHEAETCWCDTARWPQWVDGLDRVLTVEGDWPQEGSMVIWESGPAGRGRVSEEVYKYVPLRRLELFIEDSLSEGVQQVSFEPLPEAVQVELCLDYRIKRRSPFTAVVDRLFVRGPMTTSLSKTLERFGAVLAESRHTGLG